MKKRTTAFVLTLLLFILSCCLTGCSEVTQRNNSPTTEEESISRVHGAKYEDPVDYTFERGAVYDRSNSPVFD